MINGWDSSAFRNDSDIKLYENELLQSNFFEEELMGSDGRKHVDNCTTQKLRDDSEERLTPATELRCPERWRTHTNYVKGGAFKCFPSYTFFCLFKTLLPKPTRILLTGDYRDGNHTPYCPRIDLESESQDDYITKGIAVWVQYSREETK